MRAVFTALALVAMPSVCASSPQSEVDLVINKLVGTLSVHSQPYLREGQLIGCQYVFEAITRDWTYRRGQPLKINGSIGIMGMEGSFSTTLKVVVNEIKASSDFQLTLIPSPPSRAYLIDKEMKTNVSTLISAEKSDTPGALFSVYSATPTMGMISEAMETKTLTIAFNQKDGSSDLQLPINLSTEQTDDEGKRTYSERPTSDFVVCTQRLLETLQKTSD